MNRALFASVGAALVAGLLAPAALNAQQAPAKAAAPAVKSTPAVKTAATKVAVYKASRNSFGQPNLEGQWTNATITRETRPANVQGRAVYTPEEVIREEGIIQTEIAVGNRSTDPNAPPPSKGGDPLPKGIRPELAAGGGAVGGYDRGWLDTGSAVMRVGGQPRTSILTTPDGRYPARKANAAAPAAGRGPAPAAQADPYAPIAPRGGATPGTTQTATGRVSTIPGVGGLDNPEQRSLGDRCILSFGRNAGPPMMPNGYYPNNYASVQGKDSVAIQTEMVHDTRVVRLNSKHRTDGVRPWFGDSIGRYEGETLIVETKNIPQAQAYAGSWENLTVTEKFTRVSPTRLLYQFVINDPTLWDAAWGGEYEFAMLPSTQRVEEYACHEGNYALEGILEGARAADRATTGPVSAR